MSNTFSRRRLLGTLAGSPAALAAPARRPNVLFIAVDDLTTALGCYGHPIAKTPNVDRLAARGVRFDRAYCQAPVCNPSRTSFLSGLRPDRTGVFGNLTPLRAHLKDYVFLPEYFHNHGYVTARTGKIVHDFFADQMSWDVSYDVLKDGAGGPRDGIPKVSPFRTQATSRRDDEEPDGRNVAKALELMEQNREKPFFLAVGLRKPHEPFVAPKKYYEIYPPEQLKLPPAGREGIPPIHLLMHHETGAPEEQNRAAVAAYLACTSFMDSQTGLLLEGLDRLHLTKNTIIVFFGDNGFLLGQHGMWRKMSLLDESARIPLIVAGPGVRAGEVSPRTVELVSLYATLASMCGLPVPPHLDGPSLTPLLRNPRARWDHPAYCVTTRDGGKFGRAVYTERYAFFDWGGEAFELYDHRTDPHEAHNLAESAAHAHVRQQMTMLLAKARPAHSPRNSPGLS